MYYKDHIPKKSLGQNFLKSESIISKIRDAADPVGNDVILEIGPGLGALTEELLYFAGKIIAVEKDDNLFGELSTKFSNAITEHRLDLIHGDILEFDPERLRIYDDGNLEPYKLVANIPYNITGAIMEKFLSASFQPTMMVLMVQKEVADRIIAKNKKTGNAGKESILSLAVKAYGIPEYVCTVKAGNFVPAPNVDSAVIKISDISRKNFDSMHHEKLFFTIIKTAFAHKRKTLAGNLKKIAPSETIASWLKQINKPLTTRAEDVGISEWIVLSQIVYNSQHGISGNSHVL